MNAATGVVGVFNLQGASWDRSRRRFYVHNASPPELEGAPGGRHVCLREGAAARSSRRGLPKRVLLLLLVWGSRAAVQREC